jgi:hypothetical protein
LEFGLQFIAPAVPANSMQIVYKNKTLLQNMQIQNRILEKLRILDRGFADFTKVFLLRTSKIAAGPDEGKRFNIYFR